MKSPNWRLGGVGLATLVIATGMIDEPARVAAQGAHESLRSHNVVSEAAIARLRTAGLDPTARNFALQVRRRMRAPFSVRINATGTAHSRTVQTKSFKIIDANQLSQTVHQGGQTIAGSHTGIESQTITRHNPYTGLLAGALEWQVLLQPPSLDSVTSIQAPASYQGFLAGSLAPGPVDVVYAIPACGVTVHLAGKSVDTGKSDLPAVVFPSDYHSPVVAVGVRPQPGTVTVRGSQRSSNGLPVTFLPSNATTTLPLLAVDYAPPFLADNALGLQSANAQFAQAAIERLNLGSDEMSGDDYLGQRVQSGAGYTISASIAAARSVADIGNNSPDNAYRGATIRTQPSSNRLETVVHWHVGPGDSLQYQVLWTATGPVGQRPISSMPVTGPCDS